MKTVTEKYINDIHSLPLSDISLLLDECIEALGLCDIKQCCEALGVQRSRIYK